jgi:hypothetical protein
VGAAPQLAYRLFLESLASRGVMVRVVPGLAACASCTSTCLQKQSTRAAQIVSCLCGSCVLMRHLHEPLVENGWVLACVDV